MCHVVLSQSFARRCFSNPRTNSNSLHPSLYLIIDDHSVELTVESHRVAEDPDGNLKAPSGSILESIVERGKLQCGVVIPEGMPEDEMLSSKNQTGMNVDLCHTVAASVFYGDYSDVDIFPFYSMDEAFDSLGNGTVDLIAGTVVHKWYDMQDQDEGYHFSTPYLYTVDDEDSTTVNSIAFATRDDDIFFSSYVNAVVMALFYAVEEAISQKKSNRMPLTSTFGKDFRWLMRYTISYAGNYDELYEKHFGEDSERGRNMVNEESGPQFHSYPGLAVELL